MLRLHRLGDLPGKDFLDRDGLKLGKRSLPGQEIVQGSEGRSCSPQRSDARAIIAQ